MLPMVRSLYSLNNNIIVHVYRPGFRPHRIVVNYHIIPITPISEPECWACSRFPELLPLQNPVTKLPSPKPPRMNADPGSFWNRK